MKRFLASVWIVWFCLLFTFPAQAQDDQYVRIYSLIQEADALYASKQPAAALAKYREAQTALHQFQRLFPEWNTNVVKYRTSFLAAIISEISTRYPEADAPTGVGGTNVPPSAATGVKVPAETESQLNEMQAQIRQLEADNSLLESKLKEALRAQPASVDPRTLARVEKENETLQKENALLKVNLAERPVQTAPAVDTKALDQLKRQLEEANRKAAAQGERATALASERDELQNKLDSMIPAAWNATNIQATQKALEDANRQLAERSEEASRLALERTALQERVKVMMTEAEAMTALRAENEILKQQLAELKTVPAADTEKSARELAEAQAQIAVLKSDQNVLRLEKAALENKFKELAARPPAMVTNIVTVPTVAQDSTRVKQLENERDELQAKFETVQKELAGLKSRGPGAKVEELQGEIQLLRTRLAVMETQKVPYSEEEAALIKKTEAQLVESRPRKKSSRELPPGTMALVAEAQKDFAARRFEQAEDKYQQVLKKDENNVYTLANLAAIQIEMGRFDQAEKNIQQALANAPEDAYSLSLMGFLRFRQNRFDEALDALGRAAKLDPQNAEVQNYLGLTLGQKGMRNAAESALRKAVTLDPNYGSAHYNLAVIYLTQKPQRLELAQLHYRKALAAGMSPSVDMERMLNQVKSIEVVP